MLRQFPCFHWLLVCSRLYLMYKHRLLLRGLWMWILWDLLASLRLLGLIPLNHRFLPNHLWWLWLLESCFRGIHNHYGKYIGCYITYLQTMLLLWGHLLLRLHHCQLFGMLMSNQHIRQIMARLLFLHWMLYIWSRLPCSEARDFLRFGITSSRLNQSLLRSRFLSLCLPGT